MAIIRIENMQFYAHHGCYETEQKVGTRFSIDLTFEYDSSKAELSDNINDAISYLDVYQVVKREMSIPSHLIENVARRIKNAVATEFPNAENIKVKLCKLNPTLGGQVEQVSTEI